MLIMAAVADVAVAAAGCFCMLATVAATCYGSGATRVCWRSGNHDEHLQPPARRLELLRESRAARLAGSRGGMPGGSNAAQLGGDLHGVAVTVTLAADLGPCRARCRRPRRCPEALSTACGIAVTSGATFSCGASLVRMRRPMHAAGCNLSSKSNSASAHCFCWSEGCKPPCMGFAAGSSCISGEALIAVRPALLFAVLRSSSMRLISSCRSDLCSSADAEGRRLGSCESSSVAMVFNSRE